MNTLTPIFAEQIRALKQKREADAAAKGHARRAAKAQHPALITGGTSPIEKYNAANRLADLLAKYEYEQAASGGNWRSRYQQSGSYATRVFVDDAGSEHWVSLSQSDAEAGLGVQSANGSRFGDAFDLYTHYEHAGDRNAALAARGKEEAMRRQAQRDENAEIGAGPNAIPLAEILSSDQIRDRFVFILDGSQAADLTNPKRILALPEFRNALAGSKHPIPGTNGSTKLVTATQFWLESPERKQADTITFHAGASLMTRCPNGRQALNIWRPQVRSNVPEIWESYAKSFVDHVTLLWGEDADAFFDWLAHIEQKPGELPHFGWLHISRLHGTGRNWVASVLARLWSGNVAASLDLAGLLEGTFNDRLSQCLLAIVDEVNEGGSQKYKTANRLRQLVTPEVREINPKYGRRRVEHNAARWLILSNHTGALPLDEHDRRFWVVRHEGEPRDAAYYGRLYHLLRDPDFIGSVAEFLRQRDISGFNPGQRPPMNDAKTALVEFSQSEEDAVCKALATHWPVDLITAAELKRKLPIGSDLTKPCVRYAMDRAGIRKCLKKVRHGGSSQTIYALRNYDKWTGCNADQVRGEINRASSDEKDAAIEVDEGG